MPRQKLGITVGFVERALTWDLSRSTWIDSGVAAAVVALGQIEVRLNPDIHPKGAAAVCELVLGLALLFRRRNPLATMFAVSIAASVEAIFKVPLQQPLAPLVASVIAVYSLVTYAAVERALVGAVVGLTGVAVETASQRKGIGNFVFALVFLVGAWIAGRTIRARTARTLELEQEQRQIAAEAAEYERRRIARELHDVISHSLGVLVLQAGAAEQVLESNPLQAREVLRSIRATGQEAIGELGTLLAAVRGAPEQSRRPQPTLSELDRLLESARDAGLPCTLRIEGERRELTPALELCGYRIIQEGLTNAIKHSGADTASIVVRYGAGELHLQVVDDGSGAGSGWGSRRGLIGVKERVGLFGGSFEAGPTPGGGWQLRATLPLTR